MMMMMMMMWRRIFLRVFVGLCPVSTSALLVELDVDEGL
jgi:hypothetical protein